MSIAKHNYKYLVLLMATLFLTTSKAQQTNFIHIQSENNQPFVVQLNGNNYSSSLTGYIVVPQVPPGEHTLVIAFPRNQFPEYSFQCTVANKPRGFSLKQAVDNSWSLFDMVNFNIIKGALASKEPVQQQVTQPAEPIVQKPVYNNPVQTTEEKRIIKKDPSPQAVSRVLKIFDKASASGIDQVYIIINRGKADTVALFIPVLKGDTQKPGTQILPPSPKNGERPIQPAQEMAVLKQMPRQILLSK